MRSKIIMAALLSLFSSAAFAEQIVWDQPAGQASSAPVYQQQPTKQSPAFGVYHENLNYEGNAKLNKTDIKKLQRALSSRGFYKGKVDGLWGGATSQAILDFQGATNQALTGTVTLETLQDLGVKVDGNKY